MSAIDDIADEIGRLDPRKSIAVLFLLPDCDMACRFCGGEEGFSAMTFEQAAGLLRELRTRSIRNVVLGGGEPLLWPHGLVRLSELAKELGFLVQVSSSGAVLPPRFETIASIDRWILPLEAVDQRVHDRLRKHRDGHHRLVLEALDTLVGARKEFSVATVVTRENFEHLSDVASFLERLRAGGAAVHAWHLYRFLAIGRAGRQNAAELSIPDDVYLDTCRRLRQRDRGFPIYLRLDMLRSRSVEYFWYEDDTLRIGSRVLETL